MLQIIRRTLLRIGYALPTFLQRPFNSYLYDSTQPLSVGAHRRSHSDHQATVRLEFIGGCRDGETIEGQLANPLYWACNCGAVGKVFAVASEADVDALLNGEPTGPVLNHKYRVIDKQEVSGIIHVRAVAVQ
jgi:hypothetical protein